MHSLWGLLTLLLAHANPSSPSHLVVSLCSCGTLPLPALPGRHHPCWPHSAQLWGCQHPQDQDQSMSRAGAAWTRLTCTFPLCSPGMAFALLANLPPVNGLYSSFFPLITYLFLGGIHQMVPGESAEHFSAQGS